MSQTPKEPISSEAPMPRWVKAFSLVAGIGVAIFAAVHLAGGGFRGHSMSDDSDAQSEPTKNTE